MNRQAIGIEECPYELEVGQKLIIIIIIIIIIVIVIIISASRDSSTKFIGQAQNEVGIGSIREMMISRQTRMHAMMTTANPMTRSDENGIAVVQRTEKPTDCVEQTLINQSSSSVNTTIPSDPAFYDNLLSIQNRLQLLQTQLLQRIEATHLPPNPVDVLMDALGGEGSVADMTDRPYRILRHHPGVVDSSTNAIRAWRESNNNKSSNNNNNDNNNNNNDNNNNNSTINMTNTLHIIMDIPPSIDHILQQCHSVHSSPSSTQSLPLNYVFLLSSIGGEHHLASTIHKHFSALGANVKTSFHTSRLLGGTQDDHGLNFTKQALHLLIETIFLQSPDNTAISIPAGNPLYLPGNESLQLVMTDTDQRESTRYQQGNSLEKLCMMATWLRSIDYQSIQEGDTSFFFHRLLGLELWKQHVLINYLETVR